MNLISRWMAPGVLASGLLAAALVPQPAQAQSNELMRVIVDVADVMMGGNQPYYRHGAYGQDDRLVMARDRYGRPVYYRQVPQQGYYGVTPQRAGYGAYPAASQARHAKCNKHGKCKVEYYDPRYDRSGYRDDRYSGYDGRRW